MSDAAETVGTAEDLAFFEAEVLPVLEQNCFKCHGTGEVEGSLSLASRASILKGGDSGPAVNLADPKASPLIEAINYESSEMPPTGKMSPQSIAVLTKWVERGLPMPAQIEIASQAHGPPQVNDETKSFWAFQPVRRPEVPAVATKGWGEHPIDAFVLAQLEAHNMEPNPPAKPQELYRRLHYDLLGLPPTPAAAERFVAAYQADPEGTWSATVDELLESPHYGEHWARYWLDLVRYAETNSYERDGAKPFVWRYRDYVIRSLNNDKPYDQFIREQLAGDELDEVTQEALIATGFYRLGLWDDEPADPKLAYYDGLDDIVSTTSQAFLGLTMNCARCHDHKLDPIPQADYYRFLAFFRNVQHYGTRGGASVEQASVTSIASPEEEAQFAEEKAIWERRVAELRAALDVVEERIRPHLQGGEIDDFKRDSERLRVIRKHEGEWISPEELDEYARVRKEWTDLRNSPPKSLQALVVKEHGPSAPATHILLRAAVRSRKGTSWRPRSPRCCRDRRRASWFRPMVTAPVDGARWRNGSRRRRTR
ncbi:MAG: DUF1549 domain-containing protein [Planctomycetaceae bacterium]